MMVYENVIVIFWI